MQTNRLGGRTAKNIVHQAIDEDKLEERVEAASGHRAGLQRHLRRPAVEQITGLSRSTIYELMARGKFPRPVKLTAKAVAWPESVIQTWLEDRAAQSSRSA